MKISFNWLKACLPALNVGPQALEALLPLLGFDVSASRLHGLPPLEQVVIGRICSSEKHPNADRLSVCTVDVGGKALRTIVCGATNYSVGDHVPVALPGAVLPGDLKIKDAPIRGVSSSGMLCSGKELGLGDDARGILILQGNPRVGTLINEVLPAADTVLELEITANRGDCLCHYGIAREVAAYYKLPFAEPTVTKEAASGKRDLTVSLQSAGCLLYHAWLIKNVTIQPSPLWLQTALEKVGVRPINNVVDITNWVMWDQGQPLHAFDAQKLSSMEVSIRSSREGEGLETLDGKSRQLPIGTLVVADPLQPIAIAGIMGGRGTEVSGTTCDILLESAYFDPKTIRKTSQALNLVTDSAYRFARSVDPNAVKRAGLKAVELILAHAGGSCVDYAHAGCSLHQSTEPILVSCDFIRNFSGITCKDEAIIDILRRLGFKVEAGSPGHLQVTAPSFRPDVKRPVDLIEEFVRLYGTDYIPAGPVTASAIAQPEDRSCQYLEQAATYLENQGYHECYNYTLVESAALQSQYDADTIACLALDNPLNASQTHLRPSLLPNLLQSLTDNHAHSNEVSGLFETGRVFRVENQIVHECLAVAVVLPIDVQRRHWNSTSQPIDFFRTKSILTQLAQLAGIQLKDKDWVPCQQEPYWENEYAANLGSLTILGYRGEAGLVRLAALKDKGIKGRVFAAEWIVLPEYFARPTPTLRFTPFSLYPKAKKDMALLVDTTARAATVADELRILAEKCLAGAFDLNRLTCFDVYTGKGLPEGKKSLGFELVFSAPNRSLTEGEVMTVFEKIQHAVLNNSSYTIRKDIAKII